MFVPWSLHSSVISVFAGSIRVTFIPSSKLKSPAADQWHIYGQSKLRQHVADSNYSASGCAAFHHTAALSVSVEQLQTHSQMLNEDGRLIGYGCIVDSGAVGAWRVAPVSESEPLLPDELHLLMATTEPFLPSFGVFRCSWCRRVLLTTKTYSAVIITYILSSVHEARFYNFCIKN